MAAREGADVTTEQDLFYCTVKQEVDAEQECRAERERRVERRVDVGRPLSQPTFTSVYIKEEAIADDGPAAFDDGCAGAVYVPSPPPDVEISVKRTIKTEPDDGVDQWLPYSKPSTSDVSPDNSGALPRRVAGPGNDHRLQSNGRNLIASSTEERSQYFPRDVDLFDETDPASAGDGGPGCRRCAVGFRNPAELEEHLRRWHHHPAPREERGDAFVGPTWDALAGRGIAVSVRPFGGGSGNGPACVGRAAPRPFPCPCDQESCRGGLAIPGGGGMAPPHGISRLRAGPDGDEDDRCAGSFVTPPARERRTDEEDERARPGEKAFTCGVESCRKAFRRKAGLTRHILTHSGIEAHACDFPGCPRRFSRKSHVREHRKRDHSGFRPFACDLPDCGRRFAQKTQLKKHRRLDHTTGPKSFVCEFQSCGHAFARKKSYQKHVQSHSDVRSFLCDFESCGKAFLRRTDLARHFVRHSGAKPYACDHPGCAKRFTQRGHLTVHKASHSGARTFACPVDGCRRAFTRRSSLRQHAHTHDTHDAARRTFPCEVDGCGKRFTRKADMARHVLTHGDVRLHVCDECGKSFTQRGHLVMHGRTHSRERPYQCEYEGCGKRFSVRAHVVRHARTHGVGAGCGREFAMGPHPMRLLLPDEASARLSLCSISVAADVSRPD